jgi:hypothetical protein
MMLERVHFFHKMYNNVSNILADENMPAGASACLGTLLPVKVRIQLGIWDVTKSSVISSVF